MSGPRERARSFLRRHGMDPEEFDLQQGLVEYLQEMRRGSGGRRRQPGDDPHLHRAGLQRTRRRAGHRGGRRRHQPAHRPGALRPGPEAGHRELPQGADARDRAGGGPGGVLPGLRRTPAGVPAGQLAAGLLLLLLHGAAAEQGRAGEQPGQGGEGPGGAGRPGGREPGRRPAGGRAPAAHEDRHRQRHGHRHAGRDGRLGGPRLRRVPGVHPGHRDQHLLPGGQPQHHQGPGPGPAKGCR